MVKHRSDKAKTIRSSRICWTMDIFTILTITLLLIANTIMMVLFWRRYKDVVFVLIFNNWLKHNMRTKDGR